MWDLRDKIFSDLEESLAPSGRMGVNKAQRKLSPGSGMMIYPPGPPGPGPAPPPPAPIMMEKPHTLRNYAAEHFRSPIPSPKSSINGGTLLRVGPGPPGPHEDEIYLLPSQKHTCTFHKPPLPPTWTNMIIFVTPPPPLSGHVI